MTTPLPLPGVYKQRQLDAEQAYQEALNSLAAEQRGTEQEAGFNQDASGNMQLDPTQQYGQAQTLLRSQAGGLRNLRESMLGRGLGNVGLAAKRRDLLRFQQGGDIANLGQTLTKHLADINSRRSGALQNKNALFNQAETEAAQYAIQNQQFNPAGNVDAGTPQVAQPFDTGGAQPFDPGVGYQPQIAQGNGVGPQDTPPVEDWRDTTGLYTPDGEYYTNDTSPGMPVQNIANLYSGDAAISGYDQQGAPYWESPATYTPPTWEPPVYDPPTYDPQQNLVQTIARRGRDQFYEERY